MPTGRRGGGGPTLPPPSWSESTRGGGLGPRRPNRRTITITMSGNSRARVYGVAKGIKPGIGRLCPPLFCSFSVILWIPNGRPHFSIHTPCERCVRHISVTLPVSSNLSRAQPIKDNSLCIYSFFLITHPIYTFQKLHFRNTRNLLVGLPGVNDLSTEQRKRLTIAVELVSNPCIIFMDEPTSGLDATAAAIITRTDRNTVDTGRNLKLFLTIMNVLPRIFVEVSLILFLMKGIEGVSKIKDGYNPATWTLEVTTSAKENELGINFHQVCKNSELYRRKKALNKEPSTPAPGSKDLHFPSQYSLSFLTQCMEVALLLPAESTLHRLASQSAPALITISEFAQNRAPNTHLHFCSPR
ncbi:hypothetical protein L6164_009930 [Bauhinia variegata]|uniref:Uncharacterized protein n=1 Tax=Bauhinia variegata TaxID=167791 RepID=A0ACB9PLP6_BAUVA|nr:hypothetical protein L6164_009930 [Bauhinia variegata]